VDSHEGVIHRDEAGSLAAKRGDRGLDFAIAAYRHGDRLDQQCSGARLEPPQEQISSTGRRVGIEQNPGTFDAGCNLLKEAEPLAAQAGVGVGESRNVAAGPRHAGDETRAHQIANNRRQSSGLRSRNIRHVHDAEADRPAYDARRRPRTHSVDTWKSSASSSASSHRPVVTLAPGQKRLLTRKSPEVTTT
jgi:hypothetical protein